MKTTVKTGIFALTLALSFGAAALPAFAEGEGSYREEISANSLPPGFYNNTPVQLHADIKQQWFASQNGTAALAARNVTTGVRG